MNIGRCSDFEDVGEVALEDLLCNFSSHVLHGITYDTTLVQKLNTAPWICELVPYLWHLLLLLGHFPV